MSRSALGLSSNQGRPDQEAGQQQAYGAAAPERL